MFNIIIKGLLIAFISSSWVKSEDCPEITTLLPFYVQNVTCNDVGSLEFYIYEDCPPSTPIFEIGEDYTIDDNCPYTQKFAGNQFGFPTVYDAEDPQTNDPLCGNLFSIPDINETHSGIFYFVDVNEFLPEPADGLSYSQSVDVPENFAGIVYQFGYIDRDAGETSTIICSTEFDDATAAIFDIGSTGITNNTMMFNIITKSELDFESNTYYYLQTQILSTDPRGNTTSVTQSFLIFVQDLGDNPPFFSKSVPAASVPEEQKNVLVFQVEAKDRDVTINNQIKYSIVQGNEDEYFAIDEDTGEVFTAVEIDRESLLSTTFSLVIEAQEVLENGTNAPGEASALENTNVKIVDVNDNIPTFLNGSVTVEVEEFNQNLQVSTMDLDIVLVVVDMDEADSGKYALSTNNENVLVEPSSGNGQTSFRVVLKNSQDFDYEQQADDPQINFQITATEIEDSSHFSTLNLTINLVDVNDNYPIFDEDDYTANVLETIPSGSFVIELTATDDDASSEFNTESIFYSISGCTEFIIDNVTGNVSLSESAQLNYEDQTSIECTIIASDMNGASDDSLRSQALLTILVEDVNDEDPYFVQFEDSVTIVEGTNSSTVIAQIEVADLDTTADLDVIILSSDVDGWFELVKNVESTSSDYIGNIVVITSPDYETASQALLVIQATDNEAEVGSQIIKRTMTVKITDTNDESPQFKEDYSELNYDENTPQGEVVLVIQASDPDTNDELFFFMDDPENYLQINETTGEVTVSNEVDREEVSSFTVNVTVEDLNNHTDFMQIAVSVNDVNDNIPELDQSICSYSYSVFEDADDNQSVAIVTATDADEGIHAKITYFLQNENQVGSVYQFAPFQIDEETGEITVYIDESENFILDREQRDTWQLSIAAYDNCDPNDRLCKVNFDSCVMTIKIEDINDNPPGNFVENRELVTNEYLEQNETIQNLEISAFDPDEANSENSRIHFSVHSMWYTHDGLEDEIDPLFEAVTLNRTSADQNTEYYCNFQTLQSLYGKYGVYIMEILGKDFGNPKMKSSSNFTITIEDSNDMKPIFYFSNCLMDSNYNILMLEEVTEIDLPLNCTYLDDVPSGADIFVKDFDEPDTDYSEINFQIDLDRSEAIDGGADNQLNAFYIYDFDYDYDCYDQKYGIATSEKIDRERGSAYNLSLRAHDSGNPQQVTYSWVYITVVDISEFDPTFCDEAACQQILTTKENTNQSIAFLEAQDEDNSGDEENDPIFYSIIGGDEYAFYIPDSRINEIRPKIELDREAKGTYEIEILASNNDTISPLDGTKTTTGVLNVSIVIMDDNDETPIFDEIIYGEYLEAAYKGVRVALLEFVDKDLNETITYDFGSPFVWNDVQNYTADPFSINVIDDRRSEILLNMDPQGSYGYCSFDIVATDAVNHKSSAKAKIFVVTDDFIVPFYFRNDVDYVTLNKDNIQEIFTNVFQYQCIIDSIDAVTDSNNEPIAGQTVVNSHFIEEIVSQSSSSMLMKPSINKKLITKDQFSSEIDIKYADKIRNQGLQIINQFEKKNKVITMQKKNQYIPTQTDDETEATYALVPKEVIEEEASDGQVIANLTDQLSVFDLNLYKIGNTQTPDQYAEYEQQITNWKIAFGSVSLFLGLLAIMLIIIYVVKTTKLKREVKVLSTTTFGSRSSGLNRLEGQVEQIPGSNVYAKETTNPLWNMSEEEVKQVTKDTESQGSGDSVLIGAEENAYFSNSKSQDKINDRKIDHHDFEYITSAGESVPSTSYGNTDSERPSVDGRWDGIELRDQSNSEEGSVSGSLQAQLNSQFSFV